MSKELIKPYFDRVLFKIMKRERTSGGLHIPQAAAEHEASLAKVIATGPGKLNAETLDYVPMTCSVGDVVYINSYAGMKVRIGREEFLMMKDDEILGKSFETLPEESRKVDQAVERALSEVFGNDS